MFGESRAGFARGTRKLEEVRRRRPRIDCLIKKRMQKFEPPDRFATENLPRKRGTVAGAVPDVIGVAPIKIRKMF